MTDFAQTTQEERAVREPRSEADMERMGSIMRLVAAEAVHATSQGRWYPKPVAERILAVITEVRDQAATEARRDLLAARHAIVQASIELANGDTVAAHASIEAAHAALIDSQTPSPAESSPSTEEPRDDRPGGKDYPGWLDPMTGKDKDR